MKRILMIMMFLSISCDKEGSLNEFLTETLPGNHPIRFNQVTIPEGKLIHSGIFSPDLDEFYYTLSDKEFRQFDVKVIRKENNAWSKPEDAFFNSGHNEHGTSFSSDGKTIYFSSTRAVPIEGVHDTWHLWRSNKKRDGWTEPEFIDIPNLRDKLMSHPSITSDGTLYFHAGSVDYSESFIYSARENEERFSKAVKLSKVINFSNMQNTPFAAPDDSYLIFESIPDLYICYKRDRGQWEKPVRLNDDINTNGRGNPYITPDQKYLFYVAGVEPHPDDEWSVFWVSTQQILRKDPR